MQFVILLKCMRLDEYMCVTVAMHNEFIGVNKVMGKLSDAE